MTAAKDLQGGGKEVTRKDLYNLLLTCKYAFRHKVSERFIADTIEEINNMVRALRLTDKT